jgi:hypothetical protein
MTSCVRLDCKLLATRLSPLANVFYTYPSTLLQPLVYRLKKSIILGSQFVREPGTKHWHLVPVLGRDVSHNPQVLRSVLTPLADRPGGALNAVPSTLKKCFLSIIWGLRPSELLNFINLNISLLFVVYLTVFLFITLSSVDKAPAVLWAPWVSLAPNVQKKVDFVLGSP